MSMTTRNGIRQKKILFAFVHRVGYFKCGIDMKTERPEIKKLRSAVFEVFRNPLYEQNVDLLCNEFKKYNANELFENCVAELTASSPEVKIIARRAA